MAGEEHDDLLEIARRELLQSGALAGSIGGFGLGAGGTEVSRAADILSETAAREELVIDTFEDGDLAEYGTARFDKDRFSVESERSAEGERALTYTGGADEPAGMQSLSGLPNYPMMGDTWRYAVYFTNSDDDHLHYFGSQGHQRDYRVFLNDNGNGRLELQRDQRGSGGAFVTLDSAPLSPEVGAFMDVEVNWGIEGQL